MILHIRHGDRLFEVRAPEGSTLETSPAGRPVLLIPGPTAWDTATWLPAPRIVMAARDGSHGLSLVGEQRVGTGRSHSRPLERKAV